MEMLSSKFNSLLTQYQDTYQEFLNAINSKNSTLKTVSNSAFIGQNSINTIQESSVNNCLTSCENNSLCSGATFDNSLNTCTLNSGTGNVIASNNKTAIVKQALYYSNQLKELNNELINLNNSMMQQSNSKMNSYSQTQEINNEKAIILNKNYNTLEEERSQIEEMIRQYETLNSAYENGNINVTSNYYSYIIYLFIAIFLIYLLLRVGTSSNQLGGGNSHIKVSPLLLVFLSVVIIFNAYMHQ